MWGVDAAIKAQKALRACARGAAYTFIHVYRGWGLHSQPLSSPAMEAGALWLVCLASPERGRPAGYQGVGGFITA